MQRQGQQEQQLSQQAGSDAQVKERQQEEEKAKSQDAAAAPSATAIDPSMDTSSKVVAKRKDGERDDDDLFSEDLEDGSIQENKRLMLSSKPDRTQFGILADAEQHAQELLASTANINAAANLGQLCESAAIAQAGSPQAVSTGGSSS